jgi:alpha/beta superfamily hydrolase
MSDAVRIAGTRDVSASIDTPEGATAVVACPPHPQMGGSRRDARLRAVGDALGDHDVACLRFDYGPWDDGDGEQRDAANALAYARERYETVGLFGYSFGAGVALLAAADADSQHAGVSVLAPPSSIGGGSDTVGALDSLTCPVQVLYGERDDAVDWEPVVERARERGDTVSAISGDHFFVTQVEGIAEQVAGFVERQW